MVDVTVKSEDVDNLVRAIRTHADAKALRRELSRGLNSVTKPIRAQMIDAITDALPRRGGLAAAMQSKVRGSASAKSGRYAGVSIRFRSSGYDIRTLTGGRVRHPVFGNRGVWVDQTAGVRPDAFTEEFDNSRPEIQRAIVRVLDDVARKVTNI
jgi:nitrogen regulatory protein PII